MRDGARRALDRLEQDVADETVADDHVGFPFEDVVAFDVAAKGDRRIAAEPLEGLLGDAVALEILLADAQQAHRRARLPEDGLGVQAAHQGELLELDFVAVRVRPRVDEQNRTSDGGQDGADGGALDAGDAPQDEDRGRDHRAGAPGREKRVRLAILDELHAPVDRRVAFQAHRLGRRLAHGDHLRGVDDAEAPGGLGVVGGELRPDGGFIANQHDVEVSGEFPGGLDSAFDDFARGEIAAHGIDRDPHGRILPILRS